MSREEMHDLILGVALVALGYAIYQHQKAVKNAVLVIPTPSPEAVAASDSLAVATAIESGTAPNISMPAPIAVQGGAGGYSFDMSTLLDGAY